MGGYALVQFDGGYFEIIKFGMTCWWTHRFSLSLESV